jgi:16S rRNA (cytosine967-C5)-methyltransferase
VDTRKVELVKQNLTRLGLTGIRVGTADSRRFEETGFDVVLVDAPCSGLGTLAKHPEIKYTQSAENIQKLANLQFEILDNAAKILNKGGSIIYSVCTLSPEETDLVKESFLKAQSNFNVELPHSSRYHRFVHEDKSILVPPGDGVEGMYAFRARKTR